jgi:hypothetical protein
VLARKISEYRVRLERSKETQEPQNLQANLFAHGPNLLLADKVWI